MPNNTFYSFGESINDIRSRSFGYSYYILNAVMFKYASYVDLNNNSCIKVGDFKEALGYRADNKTVNKIIKKNGILDNMGASETIEDFPIFFELNNVNEEGINFTYFSELRREDDVYHYISAIVRNKNYSVKIPLYLFNYDGELGTFFNNYRNTYTVKVSELYSILFDMKLTTIETYIYFYLKSECYGMNNNSKYIPLEKILSTLKMSSKTFYKGLESLKNYGLISINHRGWQNSKKVGRVLANDYTVHDK